MDYGRLKPFLYSNILMYGTDGTPAQESSYYFTLYFNQSKCIPTTVLRLHSLKTERTDNALA